jgi:HK97 gp10 family phage protein
VSGRDETLSGGRELDALLQTLPAKMERNVMRSALRAGAAVMLEEVKQRIPVASGALRDSTRITTRAKGGSVSASVKVGNAQAWYAHLVEFGTRPHVITAKEPGGALQFGGTLTRSVQHPGHRAQPFMRPAADAAFLESTNAVQRKVRERLARNGLNVPEPLPSDPSE